MTYKKKIQTCSACSYNKTEEHLLFHKTGLSEGIIKKLKLNSVEEIEEAFKNATLVSPCYILLNGRKTKFKVENEYLFSKELIDLIKI
jgi:hypothetical protein